MSSDALLLFNHPSESLPLQKVLLMVRSPRPADLSRDHARPRNAPTTINAAIEERLTEILSPATYALAEQYRREGLRDRVLTLPVMVCLVVTLIWRQVPSVRTLARVLEREHVLWTPPRKVSQQALNMRLRSLPPVLFRSVLQQTLPQLADRARRRTRPLPLVVGIALKSFPHVWAIDASTLEALFRKVGLLQGVPETVLAGKLAGVLDVATRLPVHLVWDDNPALNERSLLDRIRSSIPVGTLLLLDKGFFGFALFDWLTEHGSFFIMPDRQTSTFELITQLRPPDSAIDQIVRFGVFRSSPCRQPVRRIEIVVKGKRHAYLTNVLDPNILSTADVAALYSHRWRIEETFSLVKRLLGLSYLWTGAENGIQLQIWATFLLYAILIDLSDDVADYLHLPLQRISLEMVFRSLYFFVGAYQRGEPRGLTVYLATERDLGIVKRPRPPSALDTALASLS